MPHLCEIYREKLCDAWWRKIETETEARIRLSQSPRFNGNGRHMAEGPQGWTKWSPTPVERRSRNLFSSAVRGNLSHVSARSVAGSSSTRSPLDELDDAVRLLQYLTVKEAKIGSNIISNTVEPGSNGHEDRVDDFRSLTVCGVDCGYCGRCL